VLRSESIASSVSSGSTFASPITVATDSARSASKLATTA
jgi:hypothetical protein